MFTVLDATLTNRKDIQKILERQLDQLLCNKRRILVNSIQWISITLICFLLVYSAGTFGLYGIDAISNSPIRSKLAADYGQWAGTSIPRINSGIVDEIMRDNPQNPEAFLKPLMRQVDEDPTLIIQDHSGDSESVPILRGFLSKCYLSYSDMTAGSILENSRNGLYRIQKNMMEYELLWSN